MFRDTLAATAFALTFVTATAVPAAQPVDPAARLYSEALSHLTPSDFDVISGSVSIEKETGINFRGIAATQPALLRRHEQTLDLFRRAARQAGCEWSQIEVPDVPATTRSSTRSSTTTASTRESDDSPNYGAVVHLGMLAAMQCAQQVKDHQSGRALLGMADVVAMARQMSDAKSVMQFASAVAVEKAGIEFIADHLTEVSKEELLQPTRNRPQAGVARNRA